MARLIKARAPDIIFTSSDAEANNLAIKGAALAHQKKGRHVIVSAIECEWKSNMGPVMAIQNGPT